MGVRVQGGGRTFPLHIFAVTPRPAPPPPAHPPTPAPRPHAHCVSQVPCITPAPAASLP